MAKKSIVELSLRELLTRKKNSFTLREVKDSDIDYSEIPELTPERLAQLRRVGRPFVGESRRIAISIRLEEHVLKQIKIKAKAMKVSYQGLINEILKKAI